VRRQTNTTSRDATARASATKHWKGELTEIERRRNELKALIASPDDDPPLPALHPYMAEVFRQQATLLAAALEHDAERDAARQALRGFIERIEIPPGDELLQVVGSFGEMLTAASGGTVTTAVGYVGCGGVQPAVLAPVEWGGVIHPAAGSYTLLQSQHTEWHGSARQCPSRGAT
jgi:hypothetical protein